MIDIFKEVKMVDISELKKYENNIKDHPEEQVREIAISIKEFGFTVPLILTGDYEIIAGHGRMLAAELIGMDKLPCIVRNDLLDEEVKALRIMDNKLLESPWDLEKLAVEYYELESMGYKLQGVSEMISIDEDIPAHEKEFYEEIAGDVDMLYCPECGHDFPR